MAGPAISEKTLPHNLEAEKSLLGAIVVENSLIHQALELLGEEDFYRDGHRRIWRSMTHLFERSRTIDLVTLKDDLASAGDLEAVGGAPYVSSLVDGVPRVWNLEYYIKILKEKSTLRKLIQLSTDLISRCSSQEEPTEVILDKAEQAMLEISDVHLRTGFESIREVAKDTFALLDRMAQSRGAPSGIPTGFRKLDELLCGLQPSDLVILAARPAMGKTSLALNIAMHAAKAGKSTGFFSLEMAKEQIAMRLLCAESRVDGHRMRTGHIGSKDWQKLSQALADLSDLRLFIDDTPGVSPLEMKSKARRLKSEQGLDLLIIDYLQLMRGGGRFESRQQEISFISRSLKALAKELKVPLLALSQLSRAAEMRKEDHRPQLSDLRESGAIEQDADVVMFIYREEMYKKTEENRGIAEILVRKQRNGPTGEVKLVFFDECTRFETLDEWREE
jgi:replicative DNA helicase